MSDRSTSEPHTGLDDVSETETSVSESEERGPLRRCIVTRVSQQRSRMFRFVVGPGNVLVPDLAANLPGRGIWLSARGDVLETARTKGAFARAARSKVAIPGDLQSILHAGLARRIGELLGLARRAGQAVCGYQKVREWLQAGRVGLLVQASGGSVDERVRITGGHGDVRAVALLSGETLGSVFGRDYVVHVAISPGRLASAIEIETERLTGLLAGQALQQRAGK